MQKTAPRAAFLILTIAALALTACSDDHPVTGPVEIADMNWVLIDECDDGFGLEARIFDVTRDLVWPSSGTFVTGAGGTIDTLVTCEVGDLICHGTETDPPSGVFWGLSLDGTAGCENCCEPCGNVTVEFELFCPAGEALSIRTR